MTGDPHIKMAHIDLPRPMPSEVDAIAKIATNMIIRDVVSGNLDCLVLLTFTGSKAKIWKLYEPPSVDDVVRGIVEREEPEAIAFVFAMAPPPGVDGERAYNIAVEAPSGKHDSLVALWGGEGLGGEMYRIYERRYDGAAHRWFGVPPDGEIDIWYEGVVGAIGPLGEA